MLLCTDSLCQHKFGFYILWFSKSSNIIIKVVSRLDKHSRFDIYFKTSVKMKWSKTDKTDNSSVILHVL